MLRPLVLASLGLALPLVAQTSAPTGLPKDPRQLLALAAPYYDYIAPDLKPFHLRATYQLFDAKEQPAETGTFEYWYMSPSVHRTTITRGTSVHSTWRLTEGKSARLDRGESLTFAESRLERAWFMPLPDVNDLGKLQPERTDVPLKEGKLDCVQLVPPMPKRSEDPHVPLGVFPTYCFDQKLPALRLSYSFGGLATQFDQIAKFRDKYLPRQITMFENARKVLVANLETVTTPATDDPALTPDPEARTGPPFVSVAGGVAAGMLVRKMAPVYPQAAKAARISGTVALQAIIGRDGAIHDLRVISAPSPSLAEAALAAVAHWQYRPYLLNGQPVEVRTTVNVIFDLR